MVMLAWRASLFVLSWRSANRLQTKRQPIVSNGLLQLLFYRSGSGQGYM